MIKSTSKSSSPPPLATNDSFDSSGQANPPLNKSRASSTSDTYSEHVANISNSRDVDYKVVTKHFVNDPLKSPGGDIIRHIQHQMGNLEDVPSHLRRSSSFSGVSDRRESSASDINKPGGFRREYLINKSIQENNQPPNFLTSNFIEFLSIYGHYAGENLTDDDDDDENDENDENEAFEDVFDEDSSLLTNERRPNFPKSIPKRKILASKKGTTSVAKTYFLLFKSLVGSGVLFLPRAFYNGGLLFSFITLITFGILTYFCYFVLIQSKNELKLASFGELGYKTHGKPLKICILISIIFSQLGFVGTYILFTAENLGSFLNQKFNLNVTAATIVIVQCALLVPFVLIRNLTKLSFISLVSSICIVVGLSIIFYFTGLNLLNNGLGPNVVKFNSNSWSMLIGVAVTAFEGIGLVLPIESSMANPEKFPEVLSISMIIITSLFVTIGTIGYTSFGDQVRSIIILNLPQDNVFVQSIMILYSLAVFLTAPLQLFPAIKIGESVIFNKGQETGKLYRSGKNNPQIKWLKNLFRAIAVVFICTIAYLNADNIDKYVSFNGCFACIPLVYIYPPLIHLKTLQGNNLTSKQRLLKYCDYSLITVGIITVIYTTYQILFLN
jgi:proton-coupled amino acid transporter